MKIHSINHDFISVPIHEIQAGNSVPQYKIGLYFVRTHGTSDTNKDELSYLQLRRTLESNNLKVPDYLITPYFQNLDSNAKQFAELIETHESMLHKPITLVIEPPTNSEDHKPYSDAIATQFNAMSISPFTKQLGLKAADENTGFEKLDAAVTLHEEQLPEDIKTHQHIMIVDDVFSDGNTVGVSVHKLRPYLHTGVFISVACILKTPTTKNT